MILELLAQEARAARGLLIFELGALGVALAFGVLAGGLLYSTDDRLSTLSAPLRLLAALITAFAGIAFTAWVWVMF